MSQGAVEVDGCPYKICFKTLAGNNLECVTGSDVFFGLEHHLLIFLLSGIAGCLRGFKISQTIERWDVEFYIECFDESLNPQACILVGCLRTVMLINEGISDDK